MSRSGSRRNSSWSTAYLYQRDDDWADSLRDLVDWRRRHGGLLPSARAHDAHERTLGTWAASQQRNAADLAARHPGRHAALEALPWWRWEDTPEGRAPGGSLDSVWQASFEAIAAWHAACGRWPSTRATAPPHERRLGQWVASQRRRRERLVARYPERAAALDAAPWWSWAALGGAGGLGSAPGSGGAAGSAERKKSRSGARRKRASPPEWGAAPRGAGGSAGGGGPSAAPSSEHYMSESGDGAGDGDGGSSDSGWSDGGGDGGSADGWDGGGGGARRASLLPAGGAAPGLGGADLDDLEGVEDSTTDGSDGDGDDDGDDGEGDGDGDDGDGDGDGGDDGGGADADGSAGAPSPAGAAGAGGEGAPPGAGGGAEPMDAAGGGATRPCAGVTAADLLHDDGADDGDDAAWAARLAALGAWLKGHHDRWPSRFAAEAPGAEAAAEAELAGWVARQRARHARGALLPGRAAALEGSGFWGWDPAAEVGAPWAASMAAVHAFVARRGRWPGRHARDGADEKRLGDWVNNQRRGRLAMRARWPARAAALDAAPWWVWRFADVPAHALPARTAANRSRAAAAAAAGAGGDTRRHREWREELAALRRWLVAHDGAWPMAGRRAGAGAEDAAAEGGAEGAAAAAREEEARLAAWVEAQLHGRAEMAAKHPRRYALLSGCAWWSWPANPAAFPPRPKPKEEPQPAEAEEGQPAAAAVKEEGGGRDGAAPPPAQAASLLPPVAEPQPADGDVVMAAA